MLKSEKKQQQKIKQNKTKIIEEGDPLVGLT